MSGTSEVVAQNEIARLFLRIEVRSLPIIGWNGGGYIGKFWQAAHSAGKKIPGLYLCVAYDLAGERAIGT